MRAADGSGATVTFLVMLAALVVGLFAGVVVAALLIFRPGSRPGVRRSRGVRRDLLAFVDAYEFPAGLVDRVLVEFPLAPRAAVETGLRQFLFAAGRAPRFSAGMPSRVVDEAWHTFITYTRDYSTFCDAAFGRYLHHVPEDAMSSEAVYTNRTAATVWAWDGACLAEGLDPATTAQAPMLFRVDALAGLRDATTYEATCGHDPCTALPPMACLQHQLRPAFAASAGAAGGWAVACGSAGPGCGSPGCGSSSGCGSS